MAITGFSATVSLNDGASNAQAPFSSTTKCKLPWGKVNVINFVELDQSDRYIQKVPAMIDSGTFEFSFNYNAADVARLIAVRGLKFITGSTPVTFRVETSDSTPKVYTFAAIVTEVEPGEMDAEALAVTTVKAEISGAITIA